MKKLLATLLLLPALALAQYSGPPYNPNNVAIKGGTITGLSTPVPVASGGTGAATVTGLVLGNGVSAMSAYAGATCTNQFVRVLSALGAPTCATVGSSDLAASLALTTPNIGVATATSVNGNTITTGTGTLTLGAGKVATISNTLTLTGTDSSTAAFGTGGTVTYTANNLSVFAATTSAQLAGVLSDETGTGTAVFGTATTAFTPTDASGASITFTSTDSTYSVIGNRVFVDIEVLFPVTASAAAVVIGNLPVAVPNRQGARMVCAVTSGGADTGLLGQLINNSSTVGVYVGNIGTAATNVQMSANRLWISCNYPNA